MLINNQDKPKGINNTTPTSVPDSFSGNTGDDLSNKPISLTGIVTNIDLDSSAIEICPLGHTESLSLIYTGASDIRTKSGRIISAASLGVGDIVNVSYSEDLKLRSLSGSDKVWIYKNAEKLPIDRELKKINLGDKIYRYDDSLQVLYNGDSVSLDTITDLDTLNLYGVDNYLYVIKIANGHGEFALSNYDGFIDGTIDIGHGRSQAITEDFSVTLPEGEYLITAQKDDFSTSATIKITHGETTYYDLSGLGATPVASSQVTFNIYPEESDLYVDGVKVFHHSPVALTYGDHTVEAVLGGYTDYKGSINVNRSEMSLNISLSVNTYTREEDFIYIDEEGTSSSTVDSDDINKDSSDVTNISSETSDNAEIPDNIPDTTTDDSDYSNLPSVDGDDALNNTSDDNLIDDDTEKDSEVYNNSDDITNNSDSENENNTDNNLEDDGNTSDDNKNEDSTENSNLSDKNASDSHLITITCMNGVAIYVDDKYMGETANGILVFTHDPGTISLRLEKNGYISKKYTITIDEDEKQSSFRFPDLTRG